MSSLLCFLIKMIFFFSIITDCNASFSEWYVGIQGGLSSLTGKHHYSNAGDGDKKEDKPIRASEDANRNPQPGIGGPVNAQGMRVNPDGPVGMIDDMPRSKRVTHSVAAAPPPPPPPPAPPGLVQYEAHNIPVYLPLNNPIPPVVNNPMPPVVNNPMPPVVNNPMPPVVNNPMPPVVNNPMPPVVNNPMPPVVNNIGERYIFHPINPPTSPLRVNSNRNSGLSREDNNPPPASPIASAPIGISHRSGDISINEKNYIFGLHLGCLHYLSGLKGFVIGNELYFNFNNLKTDKELKVDGRAPEGKLNINNPYNIGFALLGGFILNPKTLLYGRIGVETNKFILNYDNLNFVGSTAPYNQSSMQERYNFSLRGIVPGCGIKIAINKKFSSSLEYTYSMMQKKHLRLDTVNVNSVNRGYLFSPDQHRLMIKISYVIGN